MKRLSLLFGMVVGAGIMYVLDPERGRRRRALLRDQFAHTRRKLSEESGAGRATSEETERETAAAVRDEAADAERTAFIENPEGIPSD